MEFERVRTAVDSLITGVSAPDSPETPRFPPLIPRRTLERGWISQVVPNLCGAVFSFKGNEPAALDLFGTSQQGR